MGDIKRKRRKFSRPRKLFDRARIDDENVLVKKYGLKNKREIWKAKAKVSDLRGRAKALIGQSMESQQEFFDKLNKMGIPTTNVSDVLALTEEDIFNRRLQTILFKKKLCNTVKQARQLIVHKNVLVDGAVVNVPSFWISKELEDKIALKERKEKVVPAEEEVSEEETIEEVNAEESEE